MSELISVIMPVYNGAEFLDEAIESILQQTYKNFEFIIINDGSKDASLEILARYQKKDSRIKIVSRENRGIVATLNEAISLSQGSFIAKMDQDDVSFPMRLEKELEALKQNHADICGCHWLIMNENGKLVDSVLVPLNSISMILALCYSVPFAHGSVMFRKAFFVENSISYNANGFIYAEDYELWTTLYEKGAKFTNVNEFLFKYRQSEKSFSSINDKLNRQQAKYIGLVFLKKHYLECIEAFEKSLNISLSRHEQELIVIVGMRLSKMTFRINFFFRALKKVDLKNLPASLIKSIYLSLI